MEFDPRSFDTQEIDEEFLKKSKVSWLTRKLLSFAVPWGLGRLTKELSGPSIEMSRKAHALFAKAERIDVIPSSGELRGFQLVVNNMLALYFVQDGEYFVYDGFEMGPREGGEVTVFDGR
jgi:hypothetical protein